MKTKVCNRCKVEKDWDDFHRRGPKGRQANCKQCCKEIGKVYKPHEVARRRHKFTDEQYSEILSRVPNGCEICGGDMGKKICFDHCHDSGEFRGLLCHRCNTMLGLAKDNIQTLQNAIRYLSQSTN